MNDIIFILYVENQNLSTVFYTKILKQKPVLHVPGMTEFQLSEQTKLGLMPNKGIAKVLGNNTAHPQEGQGIPRCELYLRYDNAEQYFQDALKAGAKLISPMRARDWGDFAGYLADPDGYIIAFAETNK